MVGHVVSYDGEYSSYDGSSLLPWTVHRSLVIHGQRMMARCPETKTDLGASFLMAAGTLLMMAYDGSLLREFKSGWRAVPHRGFRSL